MTFIESITIRNVRYVCKEEKGYPLDKNEYTRIRRLRQKIINQNTRLKIIKDSIEYKKKYLDDIYDDVIKKIDKFNKKYEQKRRSHISGRAFKP